MPFFNYFTDAEREDAGRATVIKNRIFGSLGPFFARCHLHPDALSYVGLTLLLGVTFWFMVHPFRALGLIILYVIIDGMDGSYARYLKRPTQSGAFTDIVCDQLGMVVITLGFIQYGMLDGVVGAYYIMIYLIMITFSVIQNAQGIPMQYILRTKYILYGIYALWVIVRINLAPALLPAFCLIMTWSVVQSYLRLKRGIFWKYDLPKILTQEQEIRAGGGEPPRFWPSFNVIMPALTIVILLFLGAYTPLVGLIETADQKPNWKTSEPLTLLDPHERPRAVASYADGWLIATYNPDTRFTRDYYFAGPGLTLRGSFRIPWALHQDQGLCTRENRLYVADRLSRRVYDVDISRSLQRGIAVLDQSFDTTLNAPVAVALVKIGGAERMLVSEYMNRYKTIVVDYELAFKAGTAQPAILAWYRNGGFSLGLAADGQRLFEMNASGGRDLIYWLDPEATLDNKWLRSGILNKIAGPRYHCHGLAVNGNTLAVTDGERPRLYLASLAP